MSEAKGPYTYSIYAGAAKELNAAYSEGFKAGRASREGLREALRDLLHDGVSFTGSDGEQIIYRADPKKAEKALAEDDRNG